ncbi:MAG: YfhO family protein [Lachnospiraceae bacterium]|nr:YfhO family protein [Lachnospiraceae bacterium]
MINGFIKKEKANILAMIVTLVISVLAFAYNGIYFGSDKLILIFDMGSQYAPLFSYLRHIGEGYNSIFYQTYSGFGGGFYGNWAYYLASPFSWIVLLFDQASLPDAIYLITILKITLCSLTFSIFIKHCHLKVDNPFIIVVSSVSYALMNYMFVYSMCVMWMDGIILLPLIVLGVDRILDRKSPILFILTLSASIICNYYIAYMIALFVILYYFWRVLSHGDSLALVIKKGISFLIYGLISGMISAFVWLPVLLDARNSISGDKADSLLWVFKNPLIVLRSLLPFSFNGYLVEDYPNVYCCILITIFACAFFFKGNVSLRKKLATLGVFTVFAVSFCYEGADRVWHAFSIPAMFPARYSFLFSFFLLIVFAESLLVYKFDKKIYYIFLCLTIIDLSINSCWLIASVDGDEIAGTYISREYYDKCLNEMEKVSNYIDGGSYVADYDFSYNDGLMFGVNSRDYYLSSYKKGLIEFLSGLGLACEDRVIRDGYITPVTGAVFGVNNGLLRNTSEFTSSNVYMLCEYMDESVPVDEMLLFRNHDKAPLGYYVDSNDLGPDFGDDAFENNNILTSDLTGVYSVFQECETVLVENVEKESSGYFVKRYNVYPAERQHLLFYISPKNYREGEDLKNYDALYLNGDSIAAYENTGMESIVDLGRATEEMYEFTYVTDSPDNNVYFYSFDENAYAELRESLRTNGINDWNSSEKGFSFAVDKAEESDILLMLPYERGYSVSIDGKNIDYESYRDAFILINVPAGRHLCSVRYIVPGLKTGAFTSALGILLVIIYMSCTKITGINAQKSGS